VVTCQVASLPAGQSVHFLVAVKVKDLLPPFVMTKTMYPLRSTTSDPVSSNNSDSETTNVELQPGPTADVGITKSANPTSVIAGQQVTYSFNVTNYGPQVANECPSADMAPFWCFHCQHDCEQSDLRRRILLSEWFLLPGHLERGNSGHDFRW